VAEDIHDLLVGRAVRQRRGRRLVALDVHPRVAMRILRHSKVGITMEIYSHPTDEQVRKALEKLGRGRCWRRAQLTLT
jgi:hypothetical protein